MTRVEEVPHLRSLFRQFGCDEVKKLNLVEVIRDIALCYLPSEVIAKVSTPHFSEEVRAAYEAKGVSLEWDLSILGDTGIYAFNAAASHAAISKGEKYAAQLLAYCTKAFEENAVSAQLEQWILDAHMCLDVDAVEKAVAPLNVDKEKLAATVKKLREEIKSLIKT